MLLRLDKIGEEENLAVHRRIAVPLSRGPAARPAPLTQRVSVRVFMPEAGAIASPSREHRYIMVDIGV